MNYIDARGFGNITDEGFAVVAFSKFSSNITRSIPHSALINKERYLKFVDNHNVLQQILYLQVLRQQRLLSVELV